MTPRRPLRKPHKKSRLGCIECKRRHIKVGTYRPSSVPLIPETSPAISHTPEANSVATAPSPACLSFTSQPPTPLPVRALATAPNPSISYSQHDVLSPPLNTRHMDLFYNFVFETMPGIDEGDSERGYARIGMTVALSAPYVMHQLLALSALHLSYTRVHKVDYHREEATALQTLAISQFNDARAEITAENGMAMLIFASFVGLYALAEAVTTGESYAEAFLDKFIPYLNLHRGVRAVIGQSWELLKKTDNTGILEDSERTMNAATMAFQDHTPNPADHLHDLVADSDMGTDAKEACQHAIAQLQIIFKTDALGKDKAPGQHPAGLVWSWPVMLSGTFTDLLMKRKPEALIILCHYAVALHHRRNIWLVGNAGRRIIEEVTKFLGTYWRFWLDWPNEILRECPCST
ncbi:hypothetical protein BS50DRAFT_661702 [Corynespora cassiicola Philippines]|uniref:Uncharacterized protein n=1 Tax=Corynespora cassiicola Philippines TaxID=1448308 RepID=A0A2T2NWM5_CORCC|nr:hypothetical protein BS50DRAFT_661702 [Corynespora cassiicola Philippines]